jgi:uncharacterized protein YPO0396
MLEQGDLFTTNPEISGYRLSYLEIYNWGTFNNSVYRIEPHGKNSLLTGANASGKSTLIDALLTLLVPFKKDRFYNQSSGNDKKGDRTEETYVLGNYGNIQSEGESSVTTQRLRDKSNTYSIILASFMNNHDKIVTLFQVRWFGGGELRCVYGFSSMPLNIKEDFSSFDGRGDWRRTLEKKYNVGVPKKRVELFDVIREYRDRTITALGLRSEKALTLFNQVVGVKVLNDLDDFIRNNMLEQRDAEKEYISLSDSFSTLIDAKTQIEKVKEQIKQLEPINEKANQISQLNQTLDRIQKNKEIAVYWFAVKNIELGLNRVEKLNRLLVQLNQQREMLIAQKDKLRQEETDLKRDIENDGIGRQIRELTNSITLLETTKQIRIQHRTEYDKYARAVGLEENPTEKVFGSNREKASKEKSKCVSFLEAANEELRIAENQREQLENDIKENVAIIKQLKKNDNNISSKESEIRDRILDAVGATSREIPFIGELIRVKDDERKWENSIEKILHNFALRLIIPDKYYRDVCDFVNSNNLNGRIVFQRPEKTTILRTFQTTPENCLLSKIEFNVDSPYQEWVEDVINEQYNYTCVSNLEEFYQYREKAVTIEGLIKSVHDRHEKDDRKHVNNRANYVLGWDNKEKIAAIRALVDKLQEEQTQNANAITAINEKIHNIDSRKESFNDILKLFPLYEEINWEVIANEIQEKTKLKDTLEASSDKVKALTARLEKVQKDLAILENETIKAKDRTIFQTEQKRDDAQKIHDDNVNIILPIGEKDTTEFEHENTDLLDVTFDTIAITQKNYQTRVQQEESETKRNKNSIENDVSGLIRAFKYPSPDIDNKYCDWRSDVNTLPEAIHLIGAYQQFYQKLVDEDLVSCEKRFNEFLRETLTEKITAFRWFFIKWDKSIRETIDMLNVSLKSIDFSTTPPTYIQLVNLKRSSKEINEFRQQLEDAMPNFQQINNTIDGKRLHFENKIEPLIRKLGDEQWRKRVMDVRLWYSYKAEEFYKETGQKRTTYEGMGQLSGGEKAQLTYTILGSAIAYQFGLTTTGLQPNSFRFIAIDEAFKAQDEDKARYLITLCQQLHLQLLVVTPSDNIHIVENDISFVHYVERRGNESVLYDMPIVKFKQEREKFLANDNAS